MTTNDEIRANNPAEAELIDPETEVAIDIRVIKQRIHTIMERAHDAVDRVEAEMLDRIVRSIRVRRRAERSYRVTLDDS